MKKLVMKSREMKLLSLGWNVISRLELSKKDKALAFLKDLTGLHTSDNLTSKIWEWK